jgi:hypothetical protein
MQMKDQIRSGPSAGSSRPFLMGMQRSMSMDVFVLLERISNSGEYIPVCRLSSHFVPSAPLKGNRPCPGSLLTIGRCNLSRSPRLTPDPGQGSRNPVKHHSSRYGNPHHNHLGWREWIFGRLRPHHTDILCLFLHYYPHSAATIKI